MTTIKWVTCVRCGYRNESESVDVHSCVVHLANRLDAIEEKEDAAVAPPPVREIMPGDIYSVDGGMEECYLMLSQPVGTELWVGVRFAGNSNRYWGAAPEDIKASEIYKMKFVGNLKSFTGDA